MGDFEPQASTSCDPDCREPPAKRHLYVEEVNKMWNLVKVYRELRTREQAVAFAEEREFILVTKMYNYHMKPKSIDYSTNRTVGSFACTKGVCRRKSRISRGKGTRFDNIKITMSQVFYLMYAYASKWSYETTLKEDFSIREQCLSRGTICERYNYCPEFVVIYQIAKQNHNDRIGGPGKVVQIDESKFGKRKFNNGHIKDHWVLGMIEDGSDDLGLEICLNNVRSVDVLMPLIQKHVAEGTIIHTDHWRAYDGMGNFGYIHKVNHRGPENPFIAEDSTHNQRIESQWRVVKKYFIKDNHTNRKKIYDLIYEFLWRRDIYTSKKDPFEE